MAGNDELAQLKIKLGIDASTFDKGIASANRKLKILETGYKEATVGVDKFDQSAKHLATTQEYLGKKLDLQRVKANDLSKQYQKLVKDEGANSKAAENMQIRYNKVAAEMRRTEVALEGVSKKIQEQGTEYSKTSKTVDEAIKKIKQDLKVADSAYKAASEGAKKLGDENKQLEVEANHLTKTLPLQEKEVEQLKKKYDVLSKAKGQDAQETKDALIKYNESVTAMNKTGNSLDRVNGQLKEHSSEWNQTSKATDQALNSIRNDIKVLESEYRAATAGVEKFGNSSEELYMKSQHLEKVLGLERQEVEKLKQKFEDTARAKGKDATETKELAVQYNNASAKAKETETKLNNLNHTISEQSSRLGALRRKLNDSQQSFEDFGNQAQGMGTGIATSFGIATAAVGGGLALATKKSMDFEAQLSSIQALTGASADEMVKMRDLAMEMGSKTKYSSLQAAEGIEELLKAGLTPAQVQAGGLNAALNLATAGGLDLAKAAEIMSTGLNTFKKDGISAADASNILAGSANASATSVEELQYGLSAVGTVADGTGFSLRDTAAALGVFANNGLIVSPVVGKLAA